ncbi:MAG: M23 family metallopeptidase [Pseudomarimonas sp.]
MAHYVHLAHKRVLVREGERVARGQHIADVRLTGFTRGPHLHFVVRRERDIAIPIRFSGYEGHDLSKRGSFKITADREQ